jgi:dihydroorotase
MSDSILIQGGTIINENRIFRGDVLVGDGIIRSISNQSSDLKLPEGCRTIDATGMFVIPGIIDDQVHFREPGLTHKGDLYTESKAAVAGGITSYMEMPNTQPQTITNALLEEKFTLAAERSLANFSFYLGATNDNIEEIRSVNTNRVCGVKIFMGSSTGNMLVDNIDSLHKIFRESPIIIATHCEDEETILRNLTFYREKFGDEIPFSAHPLIRNAEACHLSSSLAIRLAQEFGSRLHLLHVTTAREIEMFNTPEVKSNKRITLEACIPQIWFDESAYEHLGSRIKWNPSVKSKSDRIAILNGIRDDIVDIVATDHAPHTKEEKSRPYLSAPSGGPMVQHSLPVMMELYHQGYFSMEKIVAKMCHAPADLFQIYKRGYLREGYHADICIVHPEYPWEVKKEGILYKCGWSPLEGVVFKSRVMHTLVNGHHVYNNGVFDESFRGVSLQFDRG